MIRKVSTFRAEAADRDAIADCIYLYCRAMDRGDAGLLADVFWPDATIRSELYSGGIREFTDYSIRNGHVNFERMTHMIGNIVIRIDGSEAAGESYFYAYHVARPDAGYGDLIISGRYLDRFQKRDDAWRILERTLMFDWYRDYPDGTGGNAGPMGTTVTLKGDRAPHDMSYALFGALTNPDHDRH